MSIIDQIKQRFNNNQSQTEKLKSQISDKISIQISIMLIKQICDIDLEQLELISEFITKAEDDLPKEMKVWESFLDSVTLEMYKEHKEEKGSVDDEWMIWLHNKSAEYDNTNGEKNSDTLENTNDALWSIADDLRKKADNGEFESYREAYRWAEKNILHKDKYVAWHKYERAFYKARSEGKV